VFDLLGRQRQDRKKVCLLMKINIEYQNQFGKWNHYQTKQNQADAYRVAQRRAESTGKRHRLVDDRGTLLDLVDP